MISIKDWTGQAEDVELLGRCKKAITQVVPDAEVILYGSRARGDAEEYSDYDILVVVNGQADMVLEDKIRDNMFPIELETYKVLTFFVYNKQQWNTPLYRAMPLHKNIDRDGVIL